MQILEYGDKARDKIVLIHGFQLPYQSLNSYIEELKNNYHVLLPILDGHGSKDNELFVSFEKSAKDFEDYYIANYGKYVYAIYGVSMGGVLAARLWQNRKLNIQKLILESSPLVSYNKLMTSILTSQYLNLTHKAQKRDKKTLNQAVNSIITEDRLDDFLYILDNMSDDTIIKYIREIGKYKLPSNIDTTGTKVYYYHGTKLNEMLAKKTAKYIFKNYPDSTVVCLKGKGHCEDLLLDKGKPRLSWLKD